MHAVRQYCNRFNRRGASLQRLMCITSDRPVCSRTSENKHGSMQGKDVSQCGSQPGHTLRGEAPAPQRPASVSLPFVLLSQRDQPLHRLARPLGRRFGHHCGVLVLVRLVGRRSGSAAVRLFCRNAALCSPLRSSDCWELVQLIIVRLCCNSVCAFAAVPAALRCCSVAPRSPFRNSVRPPCRNTTFHSCVVLQIVIRSDCVWADRSLLSCGRVGILCSRK